MNAFRQRWPTRNQTGCPKKPDYWQDWNLPDGGFVFQQVHNVLADVPAENVAAMFEAVASTRTRKHEATEKKAK